MSLLRPTLCLLPVLAALGCGPGLDPSPSSGSGSASAADTTATSSASQTGPASGSSSEGSDSTPGTTSMGTSTTEAVDDTSTGQPPSACDPQPLEDVHVWMIFDDGEVPADAPRGNPYTYACTIADVLERGPAVTVELSCADGPHVLEIGASFGIWFDPAGDFEVSVLHDVPGFESTNVLVTLRRADGELVLAGGQGSWAPDDASVPADFFAPLQISLLADVCPIEPPDPDEDDCYARQRQALRFELEGRAVDIYDHGAEQLSPYITAVEHAVQRYDLVCSDIPSRWYAWLAAPPFLD